MTLRTCALYGGNKYLATLLGAMILAQCIFLSVLTKGTRFVSPFCTFSSKRLMPNRYICFHSRATSRVFRQLIALVTYQVQFPGCIVLKSGPLHCYVLRSLLYNVVNSFFRSRVLVVSTLPWLHHICFNSFQITATSKRCIWAVFVSSCFYFLSGGWSRPSRLFRVIWRDGVLYYLVICCIYLLSALNYLVGTVPFKHFWLQFIISSTLSHSLGLQSCSLLV